MISPSSKYQRSMDGWRNNWFPEQPFWRLDFNSRMSTFGLSWVFYKLQLFRPFTFISINQANCDAENFLLWFSFVLCFSSFHHERESLHNASSSLFNITSAFTMRLHHVLHSHLSRCSMNWNNKFNSSILFDSFFQHNNFKRFFCRANMNSMKLPERWNLSA